MKENTNKIIYFEDASLEEINESVVGRKGEGLFRLYNIDSPIPDFFVITTDIFSSFVKRVLEEKKKELLGLKNPEQKDIANLFNHYDFEEDFRKELLQSYTKISGFSDSWVSVRSSVSLPQSPDISFSGVFETKLNVRGYNNLVKAIKDVYASFFSDSAIMYAVREGVELADVKLAVVVQKMVHAEVSGICFTLDPVTMDATKMSIEAVYGLGDVISNGEIAPDTYHMEKKDLTIYEKHIAPQEWMKVRSVTDSKLGGFEKIVISPSWSHRQKLDDKYIREIAKISLLIEDKFNSHQDIEWVLGGGRIWILQCKKTMSKSNMLSHHIQYGGYAYVSNNSKALISEIVSRGEVSRKAVEDATKLVAKEPGDVVEQKIPQNVEEKLPGIEAIISGIGASFGQVKGDVVIATSPLVDVKRNNILVLSDFERTNSDLVFKAGGVICEAAGVTTDLAILCRELGIPAVVGAVDAAKVLKNGDIVTIDGSSGSIYKIDEARVQEVDVAKVVEEKLEESKEAEVKGEEIVEEKEVKESPLPSQVVELALPRTATKVYINKGSNLSITTGVVNSDGIVAIDLDKIMLLKKKHPVSLLSEGKYKAYGEEIAKEVSELLSHVDPKEVVIMIGKGKVKKFKALTKGSLFESKEISDDAYGVTRYLANRKAIEVAIRIIKRIRNIHHYRNVSLAVYSPMNGTSMKNLKKEITSKGLKRTSTFNIYAVLENPAEIIMADDILSADIDGIVFDTPMIARHIFNLPKEAKNVVYDLSSGSILRILDSVASSAKFSKKKLIVICEKDINLVKYSVNKGAFGVVVDEDKIGEMKRVVSDTEAKLILSIS